jgi:hypothetical protein
MEIGTRRGALRPVQRSNLVDKVISHIREMIRDSLFEPGQKLPIEAEMARQLGAAAPRFGRHLSFSRSEWWNPARD